MSAWVKSGRVTGPRESPTTEVSGHGLVKRVCKPNCKPTTQHGKALGVTRQDDPSRNAEPEHTLSYYAARVGMRFLELESRCAVYPHRGFESHPLRQFLISGMVGIGAHCKTSCKRFAAASRPALSLSADVIVDKSEVR
jgi:hypothetical protein